MSVPVLCRYLSEGGSIHSRQCVQHPAYKGVFQRIPEQMFLSEARRLVVFSASIKGESERYTTMTFIKNRLKQSLSIELRLDLCVLQNNVMVFVAELFWWFESVKPDFVQPRDLQEIRDGITRAVL